VSGSSGNVLAYEYILDIFDVYIEEYYNSLPETQEPSGHPHMNLWNGNVFPNIEFGFTHSSGGYNTVFRNYVKLAEAAWLTTRLASHSSDYVSLQYALWYLMNPGSESTSFGDVQHWLDLAAANSNVGPVTLTGQVQEFIIRTPEPGTLALLICGRRARCIFFTPTNCTRLTGYPG
jgi:hypothetical protein